MIQDWGNHYNLTFHEFLLPKTGFIVENMAAGFIYLTDTPMCFLENLVKNPAHEKKCTDKALDLVIDTLFNKATDLGIKLVVASTIFKSVEERAIKLGAKVDKDKYTHLYRSL